MMLRDPHYCRYYCKLFREIIHDIRDIVTASDLVLTLYVLLVMDLHSSMNSHSSVSHSRLMGTSLCVSFETKLGFCCQVCRAHDS